MKSWVVVKIRLFLCKVMKSICKLLTCVINTGMLQQLLFLRSKGIIYHVRFKLTGRFRAGDGGWMMSEQPLEVAMPLERTVRTGNRLSYLGVVSRQVGHSSARVSVYLNIFERFSFKSSRLAHLPKRVNVSLT